MVGMTRFPLMDILIGLAIVSVGLGMIAFAIHWRMPVLSKWEPIQIGLASGGSIAAGNGISYPFRRTSRWLGLVIGILILIPVLFAVSRLKAH
jgi:hypothetical protein